MIALNAPFNPLDRSHAYWLRDVYGNVARFIGRAGVSVVYAEQGIRVFTADEENGEGGAAGIPDFTHKGGLISTRQLNRMIAIYNAARRMFGEGVAVIKSRSHFVFAEEEAERGGGHEFPALEPVETGNPRQTIFNRAIRHPLVELANAWARAIARWPVELVKSTYQYIISGQHLCPIAQTLTVDHTQTYTSVCSAPVPGPFTVSDSTEYAFNEAWSLEEKWPFVEMHDGICPLGVGVGARVERNHTAGSITIGPYDFDAIIFSATDIMSDDELRLDGVKITDSAVLKSAGTAFKQLLAGNTATLSLVEMGGAWAWAAGYVAAIKTRCAPQSFKDQLGIS